jgi:hypothetical protein
MTPIVNQILFLDFKFVRTVTIIPAMIMSMGITNVKDANKMLCHVVAEKQKIMANSENQALCKIFVKKFEFSILFFLFC